MRTKRVRLRPHGWLLWWVVFSYWILTMFYRMCLKILLLIIRMVARYRLWRKRPNP